jgi:hypothetical protein
MRENRRGMGENKRANARGNACERCVRECVRECVCEREKAAPMTTTRPERVRER